MKLYQGDSSDRFQVYTILLLAIIYSLLVYSPVGAAHRDLFTTLVVALFFVMFILFVYGSPILRVFEARWLGRIGAASYSLYLLHEAIGVPAIYRLNTGVADSLIWPVIVAAAVILISILFYDYVETPARRFIRRFALQKSP